MQADWLARCAQIHRAIRWVPVDPDAPALAALQALLKAAPLERWAFLHHVDMPVWEEGLFAQLESAAERAQEAGAEAVIPVCRGRAGHPIVLASKLSAAIEALEPSSERLDAWLKSRKACRVDVPFACVLDNWNAGAPRL